MQMHILIRLTSITHFERAFKDIYRVLHPEKYYADPDVQARTHHRQYDEKEIMEVFNAGLFDNLVAIEGSIEAIEEMVALGHKVRIVATPVHEANEHGLAQQSAWVRKHLGDKLADDFIRINDRTWLRADILVSNHEEGDYDEPQEWTIIDLETLYKTIEGWRR